MLSLRGGTALASIRLSVWRVAPVGLFPLGLMAYPGFGRPCRATHPGLWRGRPAGAYPPSRSQQSKEYNLQHKGPRASHPPPRYCASIHGYCGISSQGTAVCAPKGAWYVPPRHRCSSNGIVVFPPKVLRSGYPRVRGCTLPKVAQFHPRRYSMRLQEVPGVAACRVEPL